ncbi:hypothetical protein L1987_84062 [Smallanthus sonchifolius]|uniref:Uncharacterized protein n=1 Tax=Smallanthus sonchifolius TaxID=185202 RepID=A0ACB8YF50_9ASTR|nr:hypothetical protein L1987_84062 [Smallanthus sonchifolius]
MVVVVVFISVGLKELGLSNRKIKVLKCANVLKLRDVDLIAIAKFHPDLEELDISSPRNKFEIDALRSYSISEIMITDAEMCKSSSYRLVS